MAGGRKLGRQAPKVRSPELQARDLFVFRMILKAKILTTGDMVPLAFPSLPVARRRLRKLVAGGFLAAYVPSLHDETRYVLDRRGLIELIEEDKLDLRPRTAPKAMKGPGEHRLALTRFWSKLVFEGHKSSEVTLVRFLFEWELSGGAVDIMGKRSRPDAIVTLDDGWSERMFLIELDRGTEAPTYVERYKFSLFHRLCASRTSVCGSLPAGLLVLAPSLRRLRSLSRAMTNRSSEIYGRVFTRQDEGAPLLGKNWYRLGEMAKELPLAVGIVDNEGAGEKEV